MEFQKGFKSFSQLVREHGHLTKLRFTNVELIGLVFEDDYQFAYIRVEDLCTFLKNVHQLNVLPCQEIIPLHKEKNTDSRA
ncbi:MAG: hypothetical protein LBS97_05620 [Treponema sp.]|jgi:hypothetical protein|nr:hypothetical protein [Treponema sp.]